MRRGWGPISRRGRGWAYYRKRRGAYSGKRKGLIMERGWGGGGLNTGVDRGGRVVKRKRETRQLHSNRVRDLARSARRSVTGT
eukprot:2321984-Rhodomonas_salina.1